MTGWGSRLLRYANWVLPVFAGAGAISLLAMAALSGEVPILGLAGTLAILAATSFSAMSVAGGRVHVEMDERGIRLMARCLKGDLVIPWEDVAAVRHFRGQAVRNPSAASVDPLGSGDIRALEFTTPRLIPVAGSLPCRLWRVIFVESGPTTAVRLPEKGSPVQYLLFPVPLDSDQELDRLVGASSDRLRGADESPGRSQGWLYKRSWTSFMALLASPTLIGFAPTTGSIWHALLAAASVAVSAPLFCFPRGPGASA